MNEFKKWFDEMLLVLNERGLFVDPTALVNIKSVVVKNETTLNTKLIIYFYLFIKNILCFLVLKVSQKCMNILLVILILNLKKL